MADNDFTSDAQATFGANDWLVEDKYDQWREDPQSVSQEWQELFASWNPSGEDSPVPAKTGSKATPTAKTDRPVPVGRAKGSSDDATKAAAAQADEIESVTGADEGADAEAQDHPGRTARKPKARRAPEKVVPSQKRSHVPGFDERQPLSDGLNPPRRRPLSRDLPAAKNVQAEVEAQTTKIKGTAAAIVKAMDASLSVPTATSVRGVPAKALIENRIVINSHLARNRGGKISFTHLIGYALVKAVRAMPDMNVSYGLDEKGKPQVVDPGTLNLGIAIDMKKDDGSRTLLVPSIKHADQMDFVQFWYAYDALVAKARDNKLEVSDLTGTTMSLTNPGGIGTSHSVPRLMAGQAAIIGVGALDYPAEFQGTSAERIARDGISKILTLTSTYDHRVIQGAGSGEFLKLVHGYLLGEDGFYDEIFQSLRIPYEPVRWSPDIAAVRETDLSKDARVQQLIQAYRERGHLMADTDPLEYQLRRHPDLDINTHGLTLWDLDREFATGGFGGADRIALRDILGILRDSYCRTIGVEYMHISDPRQRQWMQEQLEQSFEKPSRETQLNLLSRLNAAEAFETFLQTKFVGQKRFSLEGGESVIAMLDTILREAAQEGLDEVCIGMPHRGRLNVLANIAGKSYGQIFREFEGETGSTHGSGDVKYHLGTEGTFTDDEGREIGVYLAANPSHLEAVNPVLEGIARAKQDRIAGPGEYPVLPILLHGDAAFAGQGVVAEGLQMSQLTGYKTGGTIHIVVNNQVGFTTSPIEGRTSRYSTDSAKMIEAPVFHVNGDDPEACARVAEVAFAYREAFNKDVVIDLICYRRRGHNEGDDPSMTQPQMYGLVGNKRSVRKIYQDSLLGRGDISEDDAKAMLQDYQQKLESVFTETKQALKDNAAGESDGANVEEVAASFTHGWDDQEVDTALDAELMTRLGEVWSEVPEGFTVHTKLAKLLERRTQMTREGDVDWGMGELLAFGATLAEGRTVRMTGQDCRRGTFTQRHAVLVDSTNADEWTPLRHIAEEQGEFEIYDSLLSEYAVLGFEYGYAVENTEGLVLWEAQFGDFVNGAQSIIDEFISSSEQKWNQNSRVVLLLPHGYEGQGPDHSSARIERFLTLFAEQNMTVAYPSTPANHFHLLRKQALSEPGRPLVVFTPKQLLRLKAAVSSVEDFTQGAFQPVLGDPTQPDPKKVERVLLCSARVYYDLAAEQATRDDGKTAIIRVEQLAPLPGAEIAEALSAYPDAEVIWVQDEPRNQGAWPFMAVNLPEALAEHGEERALRVVSRPAAASPATGVNKKHKIEQADLIRRAFEE
ncbi:2-oxoglutarate dehydrogenase E1 component [Kytococcus aerolatus]|uniref:2-oxoglutarate dehydrogenase E1 component n=1 Tax=Kytococcus aerolatus TaxID=592308 RepID=A0A212T6F1_9MICO|nr:multifunctional oxoglutarate decarboxylase/oxoglutarate dehydrogenase thiamine pyrophosphate-binding subunit/dihydrolipoyllysine-residue succinyltransferase subunit [Kytococcus aerolatus]SNC61643.1 2-oxoglutarate dehydrogenase E1 component [Kytococcus aerolatus]